MVFRRSKWLFLALYCLIQNCESHGEIAPDPNGVAMLSTAQQVISKYHHQAEPADHAIQVVYFHPNDQSPLDQWRQRLERILSDVERFYSEGLQRFQLENSAIKFEREGKGFKIHLVEGKQPLESYSYDSGRNVRREMEHALRGKINFQLSYVLAIHGLCKQEEGGTYVFNGPYYGNGTQRSGLCHAVDCPLLDPELLNEVEKRIVYSEHYYRERRQTIGRFNTCYLGGIAHELGHGLALPHDAGRPWEREQAGVSLMGGGNLHYRSDRNGGKTPSYLSLASALRLISHPIVTKSNQGRFTPLKSQFKDIEFSEENGELEVVGKVESNVPAYALVAYLWRPRSWPGNPGSDHQSVTYPALLQDGEFRLKVNSQRPGDYRLRLAVLNVNGASKNSDFHLKYDQQGQPNAAELNADWRIARVESAVREGESIAAQMTDEKSIAAADTPEMAAKLRVLSEVLQPPEQINLETTKANTVYLSDAKWDSAEVGWRKVARNYYDMNKENRNSVFLELGGKFYAKGLYAHAKSKYEFNLAERWTTFTATIGLRDGAANQGSAVFSVIVDGEQLYESPLLRAGKTENIKLDVSGVKRLELRTRGGEGHVNHCWSIWCDPKVER